MYTSLVVAGGKYSCFVKRGEIVTVGQVVQHTFYPSTRSVGPTSDRWDAHFKLRVNEKARSVDASWHRV